MISKIRSESNKKSPEAAVDAAGSTGGSTGVAAIFARILGRDGDSVDAWVICAILSKPMQGLRHKKWIKNIDRISIIFENAS